MECTRTMGSTILQVCNGLSKVIFLFVLVRRQILTDRADNPGTPGAFTLIQLPAGTINLSFTIYLSSNYLILRGAGNDPNTGTVLSFSPDSNTQYKVLTQPGGDRWDLDNTIFRWSFEEEANTSSGRKTIAGNATGGWLWPGRSIFRVGTKDIADKFLKPASMAPPDLVDLFYGSVNYHWRNDSKIKGYMADQTMEIAGFAGTRKVYIDTQNSSWDANIGQDIWIGRLYLTIVLFIQLIAPAQVLRSGHYDSWQVQDKKFYQNEYMFQDWFTATGTGDDDLGHYIELDHDLEFDVYTNSVTGGSPQMGGETIFTKVMPIVEPVHHIGIENLYMTQPMPSFSVAAATNNYGNMAPEAAMHGIVFRYARDSWVRNIRTFMTGSHPIATEAARHLQIQDNFFDGILEQGCWEETDMSEEVVSGIACIIITLCEISGTSPSNGSCSMRNVATMQNMTNDMNMHGGYEGHNLLELNFVSVPYAHRSGNCLDHCGGEGGISDLDNGTWAPIYWSTGSKASKWSGATGPQNVFYRNYMLKASILHASACPQDEYQPYFARDGSLSNIVWQFGWDRHTPLGTRYQHLSNDGSNLLFDWQGHEQDRFMTSPNVGVNGQLKDDYTSLFLRDVTNGTGITTFSEIAGFADCLGKITPKVVGYYLGGAATRSCLPWTPQAIDPSIYSHVIYAYASLTAAGVVSLTSAQQAQLNSIIALKTVTPNLKVFIAVGGWGLGVDASPLIAIATSASARTKFGTSALALLSATGADGIDLEWSPCIGTTCISASQFGTIATALKTGLGSKLLSLSTPNAFWRVSPRCQYCKPLLRDVSRTPDISVKITTNLVKIVEFVSLITHQPSTTSDDANEPSVIQATLKKAQSAGMPPNFLLLGVPFYSRPVGTSSLKSSCIAPGDLAQGTYPYYAVDSIINDGLYDSDDYTDLTRDQTTSVQWLAMTDGSTMAAETPQSVSARALLSQNLCMGGLSVFSIDQDNTLSELTSAIYAPGGLLPTHDSIASSMIDSEFRQLRISYELGPIFRILLLGALQIQSDLSNRLRLFLTESDLAGDSFNVYKTWEGKSANYNLANLTGTGKEFWHCEGDGQSMSSCPGSIIEGLHLPAESPHLTRFDTVQWILDDADGFKKFLNDSVGINFDDLVEGEFFVTRLGESCVKGPPTKPPPAVNIQLTQPADSSISRSLQEGHSSGRRNVRHRSLHHSHQAQKRDDLDPFDPPETCRTKWTGLRLINSDTFFTNPTDIINHYVESSDNAVTRYTNLAAAPDTDTGALIGLLTATLTTISLGNQTIANTIAYINEVEFDKVRQAAFDQAHARESVLNIILNIGLVVLGFVPGVGEIADIVSGGLDTFGLISKAMDAFSLAKTLDKDSDIFKLLGTGLRTEDEVADAAEAAEQVIGAEARETRGTLAGSVGKVQDAAIQWFHISVVSADEWIGRTATIHPDDAQKLCDALGNTKSTAEIKAIINDKSNLAGLWGSNKNGFNPNSLKNSLMKDYNDEDALKAVYKKYNDGGMKIVYDVAHDHLTTFSDARKATAEALDRKLHDYHQAIKTSGNADALKIMEDNIYEPNDDDSIKKTMVKIAQESEEHADEVIEHLRTAQSVNDTPDPNDTAEEAAESEDDGRSRPKRPLSRGSTGTCSDDPEAARKKVKLATTSRPPSIETQQRRRSASIRPGVVCALLFCAFATTTTTTLPPRLSRLATTYGRRLKPTPATLLCPPRLPAVCSHTHQHLPRGRKIGTPMSAKSPSRSSADHASGSWLVPRQPKAPPFRCCISAHTPELRELRASIAYLAALSSSALWSDPHQDTRQLSASVGCISPIFLVKVGVIRAGGGWGREIAERETSLRSFSTPLRPPPNPTLLDEFHAYPVAPTRPPSSRRPPAPVWSPVPDSAPPIGSEHSSLYPLALVRSRIRTNRLAWPTGAARHAYGSSTVHAEPISHFVHIPSSPFCVMSLAHAANFATHRGRCAQVAAARQSFGPGISLDVLGGSFGDHPVGCITQLPP
ncbi:hypothetical protein C8J57DRAFT_1593153 [Mycena rebaudengoi]|nr:hypothetical protein C8J57DRAFT_1593153 [Mycena rebaudengoi]